jgi:cytochrome c556
MKSLTRCRVLVGLLLLALSGIGGAASAVDKEAVLKDREALMKQQGKDIGAVKAYTDGKGDLAEATAGATDLTQTMKKIPDMFPPGTEGASPDGKFAAKPVIWSDWNKFLEAQKNAAGKADVLLAAVKGGDKSAITAAFGDLGKNGCGACHETFREKLQD